MLKSACYAQDIRLNVSQPCRRPCHCHKIFVDSCCGDCLQVSLNEIQLLLHSVCVVQSHWVQLRQLFIRMLCNMSFKLQMYVHHFFGSGALLNAEGAEVRGTISAAPLPEPFYLRANGSAMENDSIRSALPVHQACLADQHWRNSTSVYDMDLNTDILIQDQRAQALHH